MVTGQLGEEPVPRGRCLAEAVNQDERLPLSHIYIIDTNAILIEEIARGRPGRKVRCGPLRAADGGQQTAHNQDKMARETH